MRKKNDYKSKLWPIFALCIVLTMFTMTAMAADLTITDDNGTGGYAYADGVHTISKAGEYTVSGTYDGDDYIHIDVTEDEAVVLNLDNVNMTTTAQYAVYSEWYTGQLTVNVIGDNYFEATESLRASGLYFRSVEGVLLQGTHPDNDSLTVENPRMALCVDGIDSVITNLTINAKTSEGDVTIDCIKDTTISNCVVSAVGTSEYGLNGTANLTITNCDVTAEASIIGVLANNNLLIHDSTVASHSVSDSAVYSSMGHTEIVNSVVEAYCEQDMGIKIYGYLVISNSDVFAEGKEYGIYVYPYASFDDELGITITGGTLTATGDTSAIFARDDEDFFAYELSDVTVIDSETNKTVTDNYGSYTALEVIGDSSTYENAGYTPLENIIVPVVEEIETTEVTESQIAKSTSSTVLVNGVETAFEAYNINDNNYFKLRDLAMAVSGSEKQFEVIWDGDLNAINLVSGQAYTAVGGELAIGDGTAKNYTVTSSAVYVDGTEATFEAYNINDNNYFKLRDVCSVFDIGVTWDETTQTIGIDTGISYTD